MRVACVFVVICLCLQTFANRHENRASHDREQPQEPAEDPGRHTAQEIKVRSTCTCYLLLTPVWLSEQPRAAETVQEKPVQSYWGTI